VAELSDQPDCAKGTGVPAQIMNAERKAGTDDLVELQFRDVLANFPTGVVVVTAFDAGRPVGLTIQSFSSLSLKPRLIVLCPGRGSTTWPKVRLARRLVINVLGEGQADLARQFSQNGGDKFAGVRWKLSPVSGNPVLDGAVAWLDCEIEAEHEGGDHTIVVCRVHDLSASREPTPLVFFKSRYRRLMPSEEQALGVARSVLLSVSDLDRSCSYYVDSLGWALLFRDENRWAVVDAGGLNLALAASGEAFARETAINVKVTDVEAALTRALKGGGTAEGELQSGEHETRAAVRDPDGHLLFLYTPRDLPS
jgi:flavin reductase (DIM6/NTAB) family NADH-FMN oxidoreductase RutF/catechol 2,3-dioxygenase-like lactoylglutathione lyase family enzyme